MEMVISKRFDDPNNYTLDGYKNNGGYESLQKLFAMQPDDVIDTVEIEDPEDDRRYGRRLSGLAIDEGFVSGSPAGPRVPYGGRFAAFYNRIGPSGRPGKRTGRKPLVLWPIIA